MVLHVVAGCLGQNLENEQYYSNTLKVLRKKKGNEKNPDRYRDGKVATREEITVKALPFPKPTN